MTLSIPIHSPLPNLHPNHLPLAFPSLWVASPRKQKVNLDPSLMCTHIQHQVLQFNMTACVGPSHSKSPNLMPPSQKCLLCPPYDPIYFLLVSFIAHITICNVTFIFLFTCLLCFHYHTRSYWQKPWLPYSLTYCTQCQVHKCLINIC